MTELTDIEKARLCAEMMGIPVSRASRFQGVAIRDDYGDLVRYDPLHDDAQNHALIRQLKLNVMWTGRDWRVFPDGYLMNDSFWIFDADLNQAVVDCVAQMGRKA